MTSSLLKFLACGGKQTEKEVAIQVLSGDTWWVSSIFGKGILWKMWII